MEEEHLTAASKAEVHEARPHHPAGVPPAGEAEERPLAVEDGFHPHSLPAVHLSGALEPRAEQMRD